MSDAVHIRDMMEVRRTKVGAIRCVGFQGSGPADEKRLFGELEARLHDISPRRSDNPHLIVIPNGLIVAVEVDEAGPVPEGAVAFTIPEDEYIVFRFEEKYIGDFWSSICSAENRRLYPFDLDRPRFEIFAPHLQPEGMTEWYFPVKRNELHAE
ncbi:GyrI-like domain-containing protein [Paenibacillus flagellatus]|uniref:AraC effector-binding domain-containing protein n=1 Tax=Paenibacillus flagellatus TaxID=2211139 RepID=A0A2V5KFZ1_9BACL|nr:GyrI-like domain-containing protein [Paenibacillus flagellatus]PYI57123.1 hypothetical protein DLM86_01365 [Paenibacillus flagellatus]